MNEFLPSVKSEECLSDSAHKDHPTKIEVSLDYTEKDERPSLSVGRIHAARTRLRGALDDCWVDQVAAPGVIEEQILSAVMPCVPGSIKEKNLHTTLIWHLNGVKITRDVWDHMATRLAGNMDRLRKDAFTASMAMEKGGWVLLETVEAELYRSKAGNPGAMFSYRALSGRPAAYYFKQFMPLGYLPLYGKNLGVGRARWWKRPRLYVGMKLLGLMEPAQVPRQLCFTRYRATGSCQDINRYYTRGRSQECINKLHHPCWQCPRGLMETDTALHCQYATHRYAWRRRTCHRCGNLRWFYSHWESKSPCLSCREVPIRRG